MVTGVETPDRLEIDDIGTAEAAHTISRGPLWWIHRLAPARLTSRIVLLNIAGLIVLVSGILYFNQFRQGLIDARVQSLLPQGHIIAAAVAGAASVDTGSIVIDPDALMNSQDDSAPDADQLKNLDFPIDPASAGPVRTAAARADTEPRSAEVLVIGPARGRNTSGRDYELRLAC